MTHAENFSSFDLAVLDSLTAHIAVLDDDGNIIAVNESWKQFARENGAGAATISATGQNYLEICRRGAVDGCATSSLALAGIQSVLEGSRSRFTMEYPCHGPEEKRWFLQNVTRLSGGKGGAVVVHTDITARKKTELQQQAELAILSELAKFTDLKQSIVNVLNLLCSVTGCDAAAIRLPAGEDFTYFAYTGFDAPFIAREYSLCSTTRDGIAVKHGKGKPVLECLCGRVLRNELSNSVNERYLTAYGSFFTGSLSAMREDPTGPLQLEGPWRLACLAAGFETLVLIPLKEKGENTGLLQLNGKGKGCVSRDDMPFLELVSRHISSTVRHIRNTEALQKRGLHDRVMAGAMAILSGYNNREEVLRKLIDLLTRRLGYQAGTYYAYDEWTRSFTRVVSRSVHGDLAETPIHLEDRVIIDATMDRRILVIEQREKTGVAAGARRLSVRAVFPVSCQQVIRGVLLIDAEGVMDEDEVKFLEKLAAQLGITLHGIKQFEDLKLLTMELGDRQREIESKNRELEQANKAKSEFLTNMSHELRTPLNSVIGFSELLERQLFGPLNDRQMEYVRDIKESGEHLLALINDILDLSKIEAGAMELDLSEVSLPGLLQGSIRMFREKAMQKNIELGLQVDERVGQVVADARKIKQVVFNLLSNALKFTPEGGIVELSAVMEDNNVMVRVRDTGIGIPEEDREKIFREFSQVDGSLSRRHEGTGLGLALSKKLVEMHGGKLWVNSVLGVGSEFIFSLPGEPAPVTAGVRVDRPARGMLAVPSPGKEPLVLVVEDDDREARLIETYLKNEGYRVARAVNGRQGLEMAQKLYPQVITLDIMMPVMDGWGLLKRLQADRELRGIPVIIVSVVGDLKKSLDFGASEVLVKPFDPVILAGIVRNRLNQNTMPVPRRSPTILVIDDDPRAVEIIAGNLASQGYRVLKAYGGAEGIRRAREDGIDLILLDLMMPGVNGFEVVQTIKRDPRLQHVPVIVLTAKILTRWDYEKLQGLVEAVKEKGGFSPTSLLAEVRRVLERRVAGGGGLTGEKPGDFDYRR